ncbi:MAG: helix-turn-helix domain-containing protein [Bacteroidetes bacterium]|nr:helix-turn-helix domain-containing protein [Bacteroidota bacterium]
MQDTDTKPDKLSRRPSARQIKNWVRAKCGSLREFSRRQDEDVREVSRVILGQITNQRIAGKVAAMVGRAPHELWPSRYAEDGGPRSTFHLRAS